MKCFICFKELKYIISQNIDGGVTLSFSAGYGSIHDGYFGKIHICDGCIDSRMGTIFIPDGNWITEMDLK